MMTWIQNTVRDSARATARGRPEAPGILHRPSRASHRPAHTLVELIVSMFAASLLVAGMGSTLYVAGRALDDDSPVLKVRATQVLSEVTHDLQDALHFSERTANAVTFTVPDRDGGRVPETIRYAWSGTPGDPLTKEYNGSTAAVVAEDVHYFNLTALTRFMAAREITSPDGTPNDLLFVSTGFVTVPVDDMGNPIGDPLVVPTAGEAIRIALIESWGFTVTLISASLPHADYDAAVAESDVAYISGEVSGAFFGTRLTNAAIGVVDEQIELKSELGFSQNRVILLNDGIEITDNSHYITSGFAIGSLTVTSSAQNMHGVLPTFSSDLEDLAWVSDGVSMLYMSLVLLETGDATWDGGIASGRRVMLPWGGAAADFDITTLNADGQTIMRQAIEWAAGAGGESDESITLIAVADSYLRQENPGDNYGTSDPMTVNNKINQKKRAVILFDTSTFDPGDVVQNAVLRLNIDTNAFTSNTAVSVNALAEPWAEAEATWNSRTAGSSWAVPGGTAVVPEAASIIVAPGITDGYLEWDITALVQDWIDGTTSNYGVIITHTAAKNLKIHSRENAESTLSPRIVLTLEAAP